MKVKEPTAVREARSMVKERWLDRRMEKLSHENDRLREELDELKHDLDAEQDRSKETLSALTKARRPGRLKWIVLAGGAYVLGAKAGRARYEQLRGWMRSLRREDESIAIPDATPTTTSAGAATTPTGTTSSGMTTSSKSTSGATGSGSTSTGATHR
jgi:cell division septum initiation protein DivIVA